MLEVLALKFSDADVTVDISVYNAARIVKLHGTMCCKGDSTDDRPHRRSQILSVPNELIPVPQICCYRWRNCVRLIQGRLIHGRTAHHLTFKTFCNGIASRSPERNRGMAEPSSNWKPARSTLTTFEILQSFNSLRVRWPSSAFIIPVRPITGRNCAIS